MTPRQIFVYWLWAVALSAAAILLLMPAPVADLAKASGARGEEGWLISRLNIVNRSSDNIAELNRGNLWGGQFQSDTSVDETAKRWRLAAVAGQGGDRVALIQFADEKTLPLKVGDKFPDGTSIVEIKNNGVCVNIEGKRRFLPLAEQTIPIVW